MIPNIIHREVITLPEKQLQMLRSGWGAPAIDDTIVEAIIYMSDGFEVHGYLAYPKAFAVALAAENTTEHTETTERTKFTTERTETTEGTKFTTERTETTEGTKFTTEHTENTELGIRYKILGINSDSIRENQSNPRLSAFPSTSSSVRSVVDNNINITQTSNNPSVRSVVDNNPDMAPNLIPNTLHLIPCIIWNRGGSKERGAIDRFTAVGMFGQMASWGFVVFASSYRATFNREMEDDFGGDEVRDILNLMEIANGIPFADTSRWAMEGWSRGGMMTYLALRERHDIKAAITLGGITDVVECCESVPRIQATLQHLIEREGPEVLHTRSAIHFADRLPRDCKYLIIHGAKDDVVSPRQALKLADKFLEHGLHFRLVLMEESDHYLKGKKKFVDELRKEWLLRYI